MPLTGFIDILSRDCIAGWATDTDDRTASVPFVMAVNGRVLARSVANLFRADLRDQGISEGRSGFLLHFEEPLSVLEDHVITLRREGDGMHLSGSPVTIGACRDWTSTVRDGIDRVVDSIGHDHHAQALHFFCSKVEQLRGRRADHDSGRGDKRRRRALAWQEPFLPTGNRKAAAMASPPRALVIDEQTPVLWRDAGSEAALSHMNALRRLGYDVSFVSSSPGGDHSAVSDAGVTPCTPPIYSSVEDVLKYQSNGFDVIYLHRLSSAERYAALSRCYNPDALIIYAVADLHHVRTARQAVVERRPELEGLSSRQKRAELFCANECDAVITHSAHEASLLGEAVPAEKIHVVPWDVSLASQTPAYADRSGALFVGHFGHQPNADAARHLLDTIMPIVHRSDPTFPCYLVGSDMPRWVHAKAQPPVEALGHVVGLLDLFGRVRASAAPLAFGAGIKGKVLTSLAAGIPCVCSTVSAEGLDLPDPLNGLVTDDPDVFAALLLRLNADETFNARCAAAGLRYIAERHGANLVDEAMRDVLRGREHKARRSEAHVTQGAIPVRVGAL